MSFKRGGSVPASCGAAEIAPNDRDEGEGAQKGCC